MKKLAIAATSLAMLAGCGSEQYTQADEMILCSAKPPHIAFYARHNIADTSFIKRMPQADELCKREGE